MSRLILLVEPGYRSKFPPLGLMKIAKYHKQKGDHVEFVKGLSDERRDRWKWDRVYVASLFTYDWVQTIKALKHYEPCVKPPTSENLIVGGVLATLMAEDIRKAVPCRVVTGLLDQKGKLGYEDDDLIEGMLPDYSILEETDYKYPTSNAYFAYATRGCVRRCSFCAVPTIEPEFKHFLSLAEQIEPVAARHPKKDLLLLDNNVLASDRFPDIIAEIKSLGFQKGATFAYEHKSGRRITAQRHVDFNQGVDIRFLTEEKMALLSEIAINPLRLAFDNVGYRAMYEEKVRLAARYGITHLSNYVLFNYTDKPEDLYDRLRLNVELNEELGLQIFSFPMRFINLTSKNRSASTPGNVGPHWNRKHLRAIQCVLVKTRGVVGTRLAYFEEAFGANLEDFDKILIMPEDYIIHRRDHEGDGSTDEWWRSYSDLSSFEKQQLLSIVESNDFNDIDSTHMSTRVLRVLDHYLTPKQKEQAFTQSRALAL